MAFLIIFIIVLIESELTKEDIHKGPAYLVILVTDQSYVIVTLHAIYLVAKLAQPDVAPPSSPSLATLGHPRSHTTQYMPVCGFHLSKYTIVGTYLFVKISQFPINTGIIMNE